MLYNNMERFLPVTATLSFVHKLDHKNQLY